MSGARVQESSDDCLSIDKARWYSNVNRAIAGKKGQEFLVDLLEALDNMPEKRLCRKKLISDDGEFCALGAISLRRGIKIDDLDDGRETKYLANRLKISETMAIHIMHLNDNGLVDDWIFKEIDICGPVRPFYPDFGSHKKHIKLKNESAPEQRWKEMRRWIVENIKQGGKNEPKSI